MQYRERRLKALLKVAAAFDGHYPEARQAAYIEATMDIHIINLEWACNEAIKRCRFFPMPSEIRQFSAMAPKLSVRADLSRVSIPEFSEQDHESAAKNIDELIAKLDGWGHA